MRVLLRIVVNGLAILVAAWLVPGVSLAGPGAALLSGAILGVVNALVRPVLLLLTLPFTLVTLGLFIFVVNAICLGLTAALVPGFSVSGFFPALFGALIVSVVSWVMNGLVVDDASSRRL
jgi:putative membrane protein